MNSDNVNVPPPWHGDTIDRTQVKKQARKETSIDELEATANYLFGYGQFNWVIGRCIQDDEDVWFYFAGTTKDEITQQTKWAIHGYAPTIRSAMTEMIKAGQT